MANIALIRIDSRLIHGQVITKWVKIAKANRIIIIDDELAQDDFMASIYTASAPKGISVEIISVDHALKAWDTDQMGQGDLLILFKDAASCHRMFSGGFPMEKIQIGGLPSASGRKTILRAVSMDQADFAKLKEISDSGTEVYIHIIPEEPRMDFEKIEKKMKE